MNSNDKQYKVRFLVKADSWDSVKDLFKSELGIVKDKRDESVTNVKGHFIVEVDLTETDLTNEFYQKVQKCIVITITSDELSLARSQLINEMIAPIELQLRELAFYAHDIATTYYSGLKDAKNVEAKKLARSSQMLSGRVLDPLLSFLDFGELITFLGKTGNETDETNLADDIARLMESSDSFSDFKDAFARKFKKLTIWEMIAELTLQTPGSWEDLREDLNTLKDKRNTAAHFRVIKPEDVAETQDICEKLSVKLKHRRKPTVQQIKTIDEMFEIWNANIKRGALEQALKNAASIDTNGLAQAIARLPDTQQSLGAALRSVTIAQQPSSLVSLQEALSKLSGEPVDSTSIAQKDTDLEEEKK